MSTRNLLRPDSQIISPVSEPEKAGLAKLASRQPDLRQLSSKKSSSSNGPKAPGLRIGSGETPDELLAPGYVALAVERSQVLVHGVDGDAYAAGDLFAG